MSQIPNCPVCQSAYAYEDRGLFVCPECGNEWQETEETAAVVKDANGNVLQDGDAVTVIKRFESQRCFWCHQTRNQSQKHSSGRRGSQYRL